jgi:hypothetical protein
MVVKNRRADLRGHRSQVSGSVIPSMAATLGSLTAVGRCVRSCAAASPRDSTRTESASRATGTNTLRLHPRVVGHRWTLTKAQVNSSIRGGKQLPIMSSNRSKCVAGSRTAKTLM